MRLPCTHALAALLATLVLMPAAAAPGAATDAGDDTVVQAREALRRKDNAALATAVQVVNRAQHPLAMWVEYWELQNRLAEAQRPELDAFFARWSGTYVEDRLRNDWLLELGHRRDWADLRDEFPRFRMNDDREVTCYALLAQQADGQDVRSAARAAWLAARDPDDGCTQLGRVLADAKVLRSDELWPALRFAVEFNRPRLARAVATMISAASARLLGEVLDNPTRYLAHHPDTADPAQRELALVALMRTAAKDPEYAAAQIDSPWSQRLSMALTATAWAQAAKQAALKQLPGAAEYAANAWRLWDAANRRGAQPAWSEDLLAWHVRAALRQPEKERSRWALVLRATDAMSEDARREPAWVYWRARAHIALAAAGSAGDAARADAHAALEGLARHLGFYGQLAAEDLGQQVVLPGPPLPLSAEESEAPRRVPGFARALQLIALGLRSEGVREWNYTLRGMSDRELLAAAAYACEREVYDRCISSSERARGEVDLQLRYPVPFREQVSRKAQSAGLDPALLYGLIRQESRFVLDAHSGAGAGGLMQLMPATAKWTAKKIGLDYQRELLHDPEVNLTLGTAYLKRVLDDFGGSLPMAAAAYNAGPGRSRRWRDAGPTLEPAAWAESIPLYETRDYVQKVLANSVVYAALLGNPGVTLKSRLGPPIRPRDPAAAVPERDLP